ncbi:MAG: hypothetical protein ACTS2F_10495 [Thainema sp.]
MESIMEIAKWAFFVLVSFVVLGITLYFVFSPFALVIGLFNPSAVLDDKKPQTRFRVLKNYALTSFVTVIVGLGMLSSSTFEESAQAANSYTSSVISSSMQSTSKSQLIANRASMTELAQRVQSGMTFSEVISLLGEPDSVLNDEIREAIGELPTGDDLYAFYWKNDKLDCFPVVVTFSSITGLATGKDEGRYCESGLRGTEFLEPLGEPCEGNSLCKFR